MQSDLVRHLRQRLTAMATIGFPDLITAFVLKNGKHFTPGTWDGAAMQPKMCYENAFNVALRDKTLTYTEGYVMHSDLPIAIHHAWLSKGDVAFDPTLETPEEYAYFGVPFSRLFTLNEVRASGYYGLMERGIHGPNLEMMKRFDPPFHATIRDALDPNLRGPGGQISSLL